MKKAIGNDCLIFFNFLYGVGLLVFLFVCCRGDVLGAG